MTLHPERPPTDPHLPDTMADRDKSRIAPKQEPQPDSPDGLCPVVGIGASAGGLDALSKLLEQLPASTGMGFVLVQHLDPRHQSMLPELLASHTSMPVRQATQGTRIEPNHVYVIPPNTEIAIRGCVLELTPRGNKRHLPIDLFLTSLAESHKSKAIGVILSGSASDGTVGLEAIKAAGGITFAQDDTAAFNSMPRSAAAAGVVDFVLSPQEIAHEIAVIATHSYMVSSAPAEASAPVEDGPILEKILSFLQTRTGVAFVDYKKPTIFRRLKRRMAMTHTDSMDAYLALLEQRSGEVDALLDDFLITVTDFFRDPDVFASLVQNAFPVMLRNRSSQEPIRVWVPACASGKEVYSLAITLLEHLEKIKQTFPIQIFGTDVSERSIDIARSAKYPESISATVSPERLKKFFVRSDGGYQVKRSVRELCVFSRQDITKDPPLSKMDLVSCRNLLIYMGPALQRRVLAILGYALQPNGCLLLGNSESLGTLSDHFVPLDAKHKIFIRNLEVARPSFDLPPRAPVHKNPSISPSVALDDASILDLSADRLLLHEYAPSGFLIDSNRRVVKFRGEVGPYLAPRAGDPELDVLKLVHEDVQMVLQSALEEAAVHDSAIRKDHVQVRRDGNLREISLIVRAVTDGTIERHFLILFEEAQTKGRRNSQSQSSAETQPNKNYQNLVLELSSTRSYMQRLVEELRSANEEAQSSNEELQSTNEELQTAKEELQSANEELTTTNDEMRGRNSELGQLNNDLVNLLSSLQIPILMLDSNLRIRRYTPVAEQVLNLISSDVGRPFSDLKPKIHLPELESLLARVVKSSKPVEREVQDQEEHWYSLRIHPYRVGENAVDGAVLQLLDIDQLRRSVEEVKSARDYAETILATVREPLLVLNQELCVQTANRAFYETLQTSAAETLNQRFDELDGGQWNLAPLRNLVETLQRDGTTDLQEIEVEHEFPRIGWKVFQVYGRRIQLRDHSGPILLALSDITDRKRAAEAKYRRLFETAKDGMVIVNAENGEITDVNPFFLQLFKTDRAAVLGKQISEVKPLCDYSDKASVIDRLNKEEVIRFPELSCDTQQGDSVDVEVIANVYEEGSRRVAQFNVRDITERKRFDRKLQQTARLEGLGILAGGIAHDFNNLLSGILGNAGLALSDAPPGSPYQSALKDVVKASQRAADLTRQMLAYSGRGRFVVRPLNISDLVREIGTLVRSSIPMSVELKYELADKLPAIAADSGQVQQVIMNLIINGAEAIGEGNRGNVRVCTRTESLDDDHLQRNYPGTSMTPGNYVVLEVADTGIGMNEATAAKIFDPFFTTKFTGRGLGLASVHGIVVGHSGGIRVDSRLGRGTTFTTVFPAIEAPDSKPKAPVTPEDLRGSGTILVVDDEEIALQTMRTILERNGYKVLTAANGELAIGMVQQHKNELALVILDLAMPVMGGAEAFGHLKRIASDLPIVLTSGYDATEAMRKLGSDAQAEFLQKPATVTELLEKVKTVLQR